MRKVYDFYADPGHGWLKVNIKDLRELGIENKITGASYKNKDNVYLEEEWDATQFINAYKNKYGYNIKVNFHSGNKRSRIRNYQDYQI